jgi:hypothetical protein
MITVIFLDDNNEPVQLSFSHNTNLNGSCMYGTWNKNYNEIELNDNGWDLLQKNRKDIRKIKPMLDKLCDITNSRNDPIDSFQMLLESKLK